LIVFIFIINPGTVPGSRVLEADSPAFCSAEKYHSKQLLIMIKTDHFTL